MKKTILIILPIILLLLVGCDQAVDNKGLAIENLPQSASVFLLTENGNEYYGLGNSAESIIEFCEEYKTAKLVIRQGEEIIYISESFDLVKPFYAASLIDFNCETKSINIDYGYSRRFLLFTLVGWFFVGLFAIIISDIILTLAFKAYNDFRFQTGWIQRIVFLLLCIPSIFTTVVLFLPPEELSDIELLIYKLLVAVIINMYHVVLTIRFFSPNTEEPDRPEKSALKRARFLDKPKNL